ncbi:hypothetical protein EWM62_05210 [Mucilaginibacter terrigena]|uniref:Zinc ribbon domain-containing protein n=1 Tax=Mucilaginibacter terrigena TaxID=2492395 RepID=A0A4Q5LPK6_9SPHI|nr:hypothetical protein [Mucilaginibacter terrigena]RYU91341.1 hypothetical protein EWM62_05210 [Mucilaginibacter terrigena]
MESVKLNKCRNCGAELQPAKGTTLDCNYCGSTYNIDIVNNSEAKTTTEGTDNEHRNTEEKVISAPITLPNYHAPVDEAYDNNYWTLPPPTPAKIKFKLYKKAVLIFFLLWVGLYFCRINMPDGKTNLSQHHNLIFSPIGGDYWWVRCVLLLGVLPYITALLFYQARHKTK